MAAIDDEGKKLLASRIADLKWKEELPPEFQCKRCDRVLIYHYIAKCGHKFCLNCKKVLSDGKCRCPFCQEVVLKIEVQDHEFEQKLYKTIVQCANNKYGCPTVDTLNSLAGHIKNCNYSKGNVLRSICKEEVLKQSAKLEKNMTDVQVKIAQLVAQEKSNKNEIEKKIEEIKLLNDKSKTNTEDKFNQNKRSVDDRLEQLKNEIKSSTTSNDQDLMNRLVHLESNILFMKLQMQSTSLTDDLWQRSADYTWHITNLKKLMMNGAFEIKSKSFKLPLYSLSAKAKLQLNEDDCFSIDLCLTTTQKQLKKFDIPPAVYYIIKSQNKSKDWDIIRHSYYLINSQVDYDEAYSTKLIGKDVALDPKYNAGDSLIIEIHVETPEVASKTYSNDGTLLWAIENYQKRKQWEDDELVEYHLSPYFYTAPSGYRVQAFICLNGDDKYEGIGLTFAIMFLEGEFDDKLPDSFPHKTTITIINPSDPTDFYKRTVPKKTMEPYYINMCQYEELEKFTKKDTLFFKIQIEST